MQKFNPVNVSVIRCHRCEILNFVEGSRVHVDPVNGEKSLMVIHCTFCCIPITNDPVLDLVTMQWKETV